MKRWGRGEGKCESCNMGVIEHVEHFVMQSVPKIRKKKKDIFERFMLCKQEKIGFS